MVLDDEATVALFDHGNCASDLLRVTLRRLEALESRTPEDERLIFNIRSLFVTWPMFGGADDPPTLYPGHHSAATTPQQ